MSLRLTAQSLSDPTITTIIVGLEKTKFCVHKALLCQYSDYFQAAYHSELQEAQQHQFVFDDIDCKLFRVFVRWMYTHEIFLDEDAQEPLHLEFCEDERNDEVRNDMHVESEYGEDSEPEEEYDEANGQHQVEPYEDMDEEPEFPWLSPERLVLYHVFGYPYQDSSDLDDYQLQVLLKLENEEANYDSFRPKWEALLHTMRDIQQEILTVLFDLFILADRVGVKALRVRVMDHLQAERSWRWDGWGNSIPFELVTKAFNNLPEQSTLCRWLIYVFAWDWKVDSDDANQAAARKTLPSPFLLGVLVLRESRMEGGALDQCYFHEHDTWDELKACRLRRGKELSVDAMEEDYPMFDEDGETTWF